MKTSGLIVKLSLGDVLLFSIKLIFGKKQLLKLSVLLFSCTVINYLLFSFTISFLLYLLCTLCCSVFK